jgi:uncharacterized protein YecA (UPF0149 family)
MEKKMSLFNDWTNDLEGVKTQEDYEVFWKNYMENEIKIYKEILSKNDPVISGTVTELAEKYNCTTKQIVSLLDGANDSFKQRFDLDDITEETQIDAEFNFEKLLWNMHEVKADWLYNLTEWDNVLSEEKRKEIKKDHNRSKQVINEVKIGRNDPCPCGSGKKYKKCCGK